jgi:hypothetical protein
MNSEFDQTGSFMNGTQSIGHFGLASYLRLPDMPSASQKYLTSDSVTRREAFASQFHSRAF